MHQPVLVHADVDERTERGDVADHALQHHAHAQVLDVLDAVGKARGLELGAWIAAGFFQLFQDVAHGRQAEVRVDEVFRTQPAHQRRIAHQCMDRPSAAGHDALDHRIGLGVHGRCIQRLVAAGDAQEPRALLECLVPQSRHLKQSLARLERPVRIAVTHDVFGHRRRQPGHPRQQRGRCGVDVHTDRVDAVLNARFQCTREPVLVDVVLVLAHADRLGVDLDQLGQRVLQAPCDRHRAAQ